jgi:hypothetical protein
MAFSFTVEDITKGYNAVSDYRVDQKDNVFGQPAKRDLYYTRKVYFLITQALARAGDTAAQAVLSGIPLAALRSDNVATFTITYNSEEFPFFLSNVVALRQNEADFFIDKANQLATPLTRVPLTDFFAGGKPQFFYW